MFWNVDIMAVAASFVPCLRYV